MPNFANALRGEIRSAAGHELVRALRPLRRIERHMRVMVALLRRGRGPAASRLASPGRRGQRSQADAGVPTMKPSEVRTIRRRFAMNRPQFGRLVGVSTWTVFMWEHGQVLPSPASVAQLRQVARLSPAAAAAASARPRRRRGPGRPRRRG
jgi:DNA-binding transcriptional regulator YiaG